MAKSIRTANIRISQNNTTHEGKIVFNVLDIKKTLESWLDSTDFSYWLIEHESETKSNENLEKKHFHIVIRFVNPQHWDYVKSKFPYGDIQSARSIKRSVQYLVHLNDKSKKQYEKEEILTNDKDGLDKYMLQTGVQSEINIQSVIDDIISGKIREYNQFELIPHQLWVKYTRRIESSFIYFKEKIYMDKDRSIRCVFISGDTGTGKTTFAKDYCKEKGKSYCISSSSNDPLQDYKGEDVLILDDLTESSFNYQDLLKLLDRHTKSSSKSRYHNKFFLGELIIITSVVQLSEWFYDEPAESKKQLYRRIPLQYQLTDEEIKSFVYSDKYKRYEYSGVLNNFVKAKMMENREVVQLTDEMGYKMNPMGL
jgi:hypothetical protein